MKSILPSSFPSHLTSSLVARMRERVCVCVCVSGLKWNFPAWKSFLFFHVLVHVYYKPLAKLILDLKRAKESYSFHTANVISCAWRKRNFSICSTGPCAMKGIRATTANCEICDVTAIAYRLADATTKSLLRDLIDSLVFLCDITCLCSLVHFSIVAARMTLSLLIVLLTALVRD